MKITRIITAGLLLSLSGHALGADIAVPGDAPTIQAAIDLAAPGDRILVSPGTYAESIDFLGKDITLESTDGPDVTSIDGLGEVGYTVTLESSDNQTATLRGFTVTGGFGEAGSLGAGPGGGMLITGATVLIENCIFTGNAGSLGGAITATNAITTIQGSEFSGNNGQIGGAIYVEGGEFILEDSSFSLNHAVNFGGALAVAVAEATLSDSSFTENAAGSFGGAIYTNHATLSASRLFVADNGRIEADDDGTAFIISTFGGGGIYTTATDGRIEASRILRNNAANGSGLYIGSTGTLEVVNSLIAENGTFCNCGNGAIYTNDSNPVIINSTIAGNGGFFGIFTTYNSFPTVRNSIFTAQQNNLGAQVPSGGNGLTSFSFSLLEGDSNAAVLEGGNISGVALLDPDNDYAPLPGSLAIDAGDNSAVPDDITTDLLGNVRIFGTPAIVDIGAIEFGAPSGGPVQLMGDMNGDGSVDLLDLNMLLAVFGTTCSGHCPADLNGDGEVNLTDLNMLLSNFGNTL